MGERKGTNKYYPPDYDPERGGLNKYHGTHALRERARKLHEGILIIRFEMPYNIWCNGCGKHIGMGVRYNAQKRKMGNYYTTPIYKFRMKCHLCDQHFEIQTDPRNCDYQILSGARRKEERWDTEKAGNVQTTDREVKQKLLTDAMYKLEHENKDESKSRKLAPSLTRLEEIRDQWGDDFGVNQLLRKKFRTEKKEKKNGELADNDFKKRNNLPLGFQLSVETHEDLVRAKSIRFGKTNTNISFNKRKIKESHIFSSLDDTRMALAKSLASKSKNSKLTSKCKDRPTNKMVINIRINKPTEKIVDIGDGPGNKKIDSINDSYKGNSTVCIDILDNKESTSSIETSDQICQSSEPTNHRANSSLVAYVSSSSEGETDS